MKIYKEEITLNKNSRGCYILDTIKGCCSGVRHNKQGCYGDCYAKKIADRYGFNFGKSIDRKFIEDNEQLFFFGLNDASHSSKIINQIKAIDMPFVRIGEMGDPSENWEHTLKICNEISRAGKPIVIITKHWKKIPDQLINNLKTINLCINTSVSALDTKAEIDYRLNQYERLKKVCNSVLRIVSCEFNRDNLEGIERHNIQEQLFKKENIIDTIFRPSKDNIFVLNNVIKVKKVKFLKKIVLASVHNDKTYFGNCKDCPDMCGINHIRKST